MSEYFWKFQDQFYKTIGKNLLFYVFMSGRIIILVIVHFVESLLLASYRI